jgi:hypothetical protein
MVITPESAPPQAASITITLAATFKARDVAIRLISTD